MLDTVSVRVDPVWEKSRVFKQFTESQSGAFVLIYEQPPDRIGTLTHGIVGESIFNLADHQDQ